MNEPSNIDSTHHVSAPVALDAQICEQARLSRDARFDGLFYTAVRSTGIYCRPVCPAPAAKAVNVEYFQTAAAAAAAGYRPCLRCRPELAPGADVHQLPQGKVRQALLRIEQGVLDEGHVSQLAAELGIGERQLRRLFHQQLGVSPQQLALNRRLLFAKQLLHDTDMLVIDVAMAAGFNSLRRFNDAFQRSYQMSPSQLRRGRNESAASLQEGIQLYLPYRPPYHFAALLDFLRQRTIAGLEWVDDGCYQRLIHNGQGGAAQLSVRDEPKRSALCIQLSGVAAAGLLPLVQRIKQLFDVDADSGLIEAQLSTDARLVPLLERCSGIRVPGTLDGFELAVRAVIGQQISVKAARTLLGRVIERCETPTVVPVNTHLYRLFPTPKALVEADLQGIGLTDKRVGTLQTMAQALLDGKVSFQQGQSLDEFIQRWCALPGIGPWTAHYLAMRSLHHPDALPAGDLILRRVAHTLGESNNYDDMNTNAPKAPPALTERKLASMSHAWRPWRAYVALMLWHSVSLPK